MSSEYKYHSKFWLEEPEPDNPFAAKSCYCQGYDVYGQILKNAGWFEYLLVMFRGERPSTSCTRLLETLAIALANPGPREASVRAAMNAGVAGTNHSSALMAALAVGAGQYGGAQEVVECVNAWKSCGTDFDSWVRALTDPEKREHADIWLPMEHAPGFDPNGDVTPTPVRQVLNQLSELGPSDGALRWLKEHREDLERLVGYPLAMSGVASAAFVDLDLNPDQASMLFLILRLPGAAAHALEQWDMGWKKFPYYGPAIELEPSADTVSEASEKERGHRHHDT